MILLDTNAVLFLLSGHRRARPLQARAGQLLVSPVSILELQFLVECGRIEITSGDVASAVREDPRFRLDNPPLDEVLSEAIGLSFTRDPFDRLIIAHALSGNHVLATSDARILAGLPSAKTLAL